YVFFSTSPFFLLSFASHVHFSSSPSRRSSVLSHEFLLLVDRVGVIHSHVDSSPLTSVLTPASVFPRAVAITWVWPMMCPTVCLADRKSTRLNSSHGSISYAVLCLTKKEVQLI